MDITMIPDAERIFWQLTVFALLAGLLYSAGATYAITHYGGRLILVFSVLWVIGFTVAGLVLLVRTYPEEVATPTRWALLLLPFIGLPVGAALWVVSRLGRGSPSDGSARRVVLAFLAYVVAMPIGFVVGAFSS